MSGYNAIEAADAYPHVKAILTAIANKTDGDQAASPADAFFYQLRAAHKVDVFEPFSPDQVLLNDFLTELNAGKNLCEYAWQLYAKKSSR